MSFAAVAAVASTQADLFEKSGCAGEGAGGMQALADAAAVFKGRTLAQATKLVKGLSRPSERAAGASIAGAQRAADLLGPVLKAAEAKAAVLKSLQQIQRLTKPFGDWSVAELRAAIAEKDADERAAQEAKTAAAARKGEEARALAEHFAKKFETAPQDRAGLNAVLGEMKAHKPKLPGLVWVEVANLWVRAAEKRSPAEARRAIETKISMRASAAAQIKDVDRALASGY